MFINKLLKQRRLKIVIKNWLLTGDTHGKVCERIAEIDKELYPVGETALIILGDAGINFYLNNTDKRNKKNIQKTGYVVYCVRGNHEERPEKVPGIHPMYDENVNGVVLHDIEYPNIRYFMDGGEYTINDHSILTIGGAYSIDKWHRLARAPYPDGWTGWFESEQLTEDEMREIELKCMNNHYDIVLTHTCPISWEPTDLFLAGINQSKVDKTMENFFERIKDAMSWGIWCFGHYHDDRLVRPRVEMLFYNIIELNSIIEQWENENDNYWFMRKDPNYWMGV